MHLSCCHHAHRTISHAREYVVTGPGLINTGVSNFKFLLPKFDRKVYWLRNTSLPYIRGSLSLHNFASPSLSLRQDPDRARGVYATYENIRPKQSETEEKEKSVLEQDMIR